MTSAKVRAAYDVVAGDYADHFPDTGAEAASDLAMVDAFAAAVRDAGGGKVLDAGCGPGRMSRYLADRGTAVTGVDLSPGMVAQARRRHPDLPFAVASIAALPHPDATFAGVMLWYSIMHTPIPVQQRLIAEARRVLRPGGFMLVGFHAGDGERDVAPSYRRFGHEIELSRYPVTPDRVSRWLGRAGLREVRWHARRARDGERDDQGAVLAQAGAT